MSVWPKLGVLALAIVSIGLPVNTLWSYLFVLVVAVFVFTVKIHGQFVAHFGRARDVLFGPCWFGAA